ncbi:class E sortase [Streptomyces sp. NPDC051207]|uniref:class E sortase n=1 Tax=Streptomyces sp. NPDC051207 TaxID=3154641 RepID=UPI00343B3EB4
MTALRPERESGASYGQEPYEARGALGDWPRADQGQAQQPHGADRGQPQAPYEADHGRARAPYGQGGAYRQPHETPAHHGTSPHEPQPQPQPGPPPDLSRREPSYEPPSYEPLPYEPPADDETVALRVAEPQGGAGGPGGSVSASAAPVATAGAGPASGGRAARRKAAKRRHGRHGAGGRAGSAGARSGDSGQEAPAAPLSRMEARRQARARRPSPAVVASRVIGEVFITTGVLMLLFVTYQLWWTNVRAQAQAGKEASDLQDDWAKGERSPGAFEPGQGFALLHIPRLDVVVPIAEGIDSKGVLDRGMVGHYAEGALKTAMPDDKTGNFGLAGHRNTHGEPFRYINRLEPGDPIVVETQNKYFVYKMASMLPVTSPSNVSVLDPVPRGSGFTGPGRYITLTTCTPEFTSKYRLIVWGKMVEERPRSKGKPDALVN